jgi:hypothetical protein
MIDGAGMDSIAMAFYNLYNCPLFLISENPRWKINAHNR